MEKYDERLAGIKKIINSHGANAIDALDWLVKRNVDAQTKEELYYIIKTEILTLEGLTEAEATTVRNTAKMMKARLEALNGGKEESN